MSVVSNQVPGDGELVPASPEPVGQGPRSSAPKGPGRGRGGGPKTPAGKAKSAQNSVSHAITSPSPVAGGESQEEWEEFLQGYYDFFQPPNVVEAELVHNMASCKWRVRRVVRAEVAAIDITFDAVDDRIKGDGSRGNDSWLVRELSEHGMTLEECSGLLESLGTLAGSAELVDRRWKGTMRMLGLVGSSLPEDVWLRMPKGPSTAQSLRDFFASVATDLNMTYAELIGLVLDRARGLIDEDSHRRAEEDKRRRKLGAGAILPRPEVQEKYIRYESHYERMYAKSMDQLEILQRLRVGQDVSPPLRIHMTDG